MDPRAKRMQELMVPIDQSIMLCDDSKEMIVLACAMMVTAKNIFDQELGIDGRKKMFADYS